ncbi:MAG: class I SAM-dependent methyltransferase [Chloroflexota bacterium]
MFIRDWNRTAWDKRVKEGNRWTVPVSSLDIESARRGEWSIKLTPSKSVPRSWFPPLNETDVLCLASGGGQQGPILAAAGARVTVFDNSPQQLAQDIKIAEQEKLHLKLVEGDMANLDAFQDESFDLVVQPAATIFIPDVHPVWKEAYRVLRTNGLLLVGFRNPASYLFDYKLADECGILQVKYKLPYSDLKSLKSSQLRRFKNLGEPLEFSHMLNDLIGGQLDSGFMISSFYEDGLSPDEDALERYMHCFFATRARKPSKE